MEKPEYEVLNAEIQSLLQGLAKQIGADMPPGWGFTLFLFNYTATPEQAKDNGAMFYISSAQRDDMVRAMTEFISRNSS